MVKINNQRGTFLDTYAGVVGGTDNGRQKTEIMVGRHCRRKAILVLDHPHKLVTLNQNSNQRRRTLTGFFPLVGCLPQAAAQKDFSPKSQDAVALQQIKERSALPMIDRGDIRQAIDRCNNIWASLPGAGYGQFEHKADSLIATKFEAGLTVRKIDVSRVTAIISALVICIIVCLSWAVSICVITPLPTKPSATKMPRRAEAGGAAITDMQMRQRDVAALGKNTRRS